ncbi:pyridoxamine 5'-phosphate oxidase family protein [Flavisolibacter nicotianae]|uniref:pyridoxamine 5'-phosphate oxidase family protein n=1 Tax=Flavisolibacter nicotianae TaxID=2364882 RepID=UPI001968CBDD|nr:pyridoxamine 5'-phosphate oxidase family protein [Flavisolibacter nicotianae]
MKHDQSFARFPNSSSSLPGVILLGKQHVSHGSLNTRSPGFVNQARLGFIATVCPDGTPNLSPKGTTIAWDEEHLAFADIHSPGTTANLLANPSIEINVVDVFTRKGYRFKGVAQVLGRGAVFESILSFYCSAGSQYAIRHIILVQVNQLIALFSPAYDRLSEEQITDRWIDYWHSIHPKKERGSP